MISAYISAFFTSSPSLSSFQWSKCDAPILRVPTCPHHCINGSGWTSSPVMKSPGLFSAAVRGSCDAGMGSKIQSVPWLHPPQMW
jgi:hypothetical protein